METRAPVFAAQTITAPPNWGSDTATNFRPNVLALSLRMMLTQTKYLELTRHLMHTRQIICFVTVFWHIDIGMYVVGV